MFGYYNRIITINLTDESTTIEPITDQVLTECFGGKGLATHLLLERNKPGVDPLSLERSPQKSAAHRGRKAAIHGHIGLTTGFPDRKPAQPEREKPSGMQHLIDRLWTPIQSRPACSTHPTHTADSAPHRESVCQKQG